MNAGPDPLHPAPPRRPQWPTGNALAWLALAPVVVASIRVAVFSSGDPALLATLVQSLDVPAVVLTSIIPALGLIISFGLLVAIANPDVTPRAVRAMRGLPTAGATAVTFLILLIAYLSTVIQLLLVLGTVLAAVLFRLVSSGAERRLGKMAPADLPTLAAIFTLTLFALTAPWMPEEVVTLHDGSVQTAYVAGSSDGWVTLIDVHDRQVSTIAADDVTARQICDSRANRSIAQLWLGLDQQRPCPDYKPPSPTVSPSPTP